MSTTDPPTPDVDGLSDAELVDDAAARLAVPRIEPADSFVLHAPLELLARSALLRHVEPAGRAAARHQIVRLAERFERFGDGLDPSPPAGRPLEPGELAAIVESGDLDAIDRAAATLAATTDADALATALADLVMPQLSAAGHGSIFLYLLPRLLPASNPAAAMVRSLLREIGRRPEWRLTWIDERHADAAGSDGESNRDELSTQLLDPPNAGDPGSTFIYPLMSQVERSGLAAELLDRPTRGLAVPDARRQILRVAAWSMLQDDPDHAPYGWSHALTMPQAVLGIADRCTDPGRAVAVAATHELGFRSILGSVALDPTWSPDPAVADPDSVLDHGPDHAAAVVWHASDDRIDVLMRQIITDAAAHEDAHLVKYTLACLDAARDDPAASRLYRSAAAYLAGWWAVR